MVVVQQNERLFLENDDDGIDELVELGQVEDVGPVDERASEARLVGLAKPNSQHAPLLRQQARPTSAHSAHTRAQKQRERF